ANGVLSISGTATITDGDGDTAEETVLLDLGGNIRFADDGPSVSANDTVLLDDDALSGGNAGGTGDDADSANTTGTIGLDFGADGAGTVAFSTSGAPAGFQYVTSGDDILIQQDQGSGFVTVITVTLDPTTGDYTVTHNLPVLHADGNDENNQAFTLSYTVTDGDGDTATGSLSIDVDDDTPVALDADSTGTVDEDGLGGIAGGDGDVAGEATVATGSVTSLFSAGADTPLTFGLDSASVVSYLESLGLQSDGADLEYGVANGTITASVPGATIFTFTLASDGSWEFELLGPLDHPTANTEDDLVIDFGPLVQATDADGDTVDAIGSVLVTIDDDTPVADLDIASISEDTPSVGGNVISDDAFGGDGQGDPAVIAVTGAGGRAGVVGGTTTGALGTLTLNGDGTYTYTLDTAAAQYLDDGERFFDSFTYTIVDDDGDTSTTKLVIVINGANDAPEASDDTNWVLDVVVGADPSTSGNVLDDLDHPGAPSGSFADAADNDVDGDNLTITGVTGGSVGASLAGNYGAIVINADGTYTYTLDAENAVVDALNDGETLTDTFTYTVSDGTATDTATVTVTIFGVNDPVVVTSTEVSVSEEGLAGGNPDNDPISPSGVDTTDSATTSGAIGIADPDNTTFTVTLATPSTPGLTSNGETIVWSLNADENVLTGSTSAGSIIVVAIDDNGEFDVTLNGPVDHPDTTSEDNLFIDIGVSVSDGASTTSLATGIRVYVEDDSPIIGELTPDSVTVANAKNATGTGTFDYSPGGDGHGEFQITYTGDPIDGLTYTLEQLDSDNDGQNDGAILTASANGTDVYTLEVDVDGNYSYTLLAPDTGTTESISLLNLSAGGPSFRELEDNPSTPVNENGRIEFDSNGVNGVNASSAGFGVDNQWVDTGEFFTMEFHDPGNLGVNDAPQTDADILSGVTLFAQQVRGGASTFQWTTTRYNDDGTVAETQTGTIVISGSGPIVIPTTIEFSELKMENLSGGDVRFQAKVIVEHNVLPQDVLLDFEISATDTDGDVTSVSSLSVFVDADLTLAAPVALKGDKVAQSDVLDVSLAGSSEGTGRSTETVTSYEGERMLARASEWTAIAASAAAFAMPTIEAAFAQEYGGTASPGNHMVNFEFAAASMIEAPQLPEAYAEHFGGRVEIDAMEGQDIAMAHILDDAGAFTGSRIEESMGLDLNAVDYADPAEVFAGVPSAFEGIALGDTGSAMEALLMLEANVPQDAAGSLVEGGSALEEAVAELHAEAQIDAVVAHFAANDIGSDESGMLTVPVEGLLDGMVGNGNPFHAVGIVQTDQTDEAALLAATA
ncbi:VCBS domain-containing protein, partial [Qipengyuania aquimaris]